MGRYIRGSIDENLSLGTLASKTLVGDSWDESVEERSLVTSIVVTWALDLLTSSQGPILFGVAHSAYTDAQIEEVIENTGSWAEGSLIQQEIAKRKIRIIGTFVNLVASGTSDVGFNDGKPLKTKLNWILTSDQRIRMWAYNTSGAALSTTVPVMLASGHANIFPR